MPKEALDSLRSIQGTLSELLPRLPELRDCGIISAKDSITVVESVRSYLPDTLAAYLRLPKFYAQMQTLADGRTAKQTFRPLAPLHADDLALIEQGRREVFSL